VGAGALVASLLTDALASRPNPLHDSMARTGRSANATVNGNLTVTGVLHANKNETVYGNFYTRGKAEVYQGLTVRDKGLTVKAGGIKGDTLDISGALHAKSGAVDDNFLAGSLQATTISGTTLTLAGAATVGGTLNASGRITGNGLDAGSGGLTTTGNVSAGGITASSITDSGALTAGSMRVTGTVDLSGATVNFANATVTGLSGGGSTGGGATQFSQLTVGNATSTTPAFYLAGNGRTVPITVNSSGDIAVQSLATQGNLTVGGNLSVLGTSSLNVGSITAPTATGTTSPGPFTLTASSIGLTGNTTVTGNATVTGTTSLNGTTTLNGSNDLVLGTAAATSTTAATAAHLDGNRDVAGVVSVAVPVGGTGPTPAVQSTTVTFVRPYTSQPIVVVTPTGDPAPGQPYAPKVWVTLVPSTTTTGQYTGFTINYQNAATTTAASQGYNVGFNYHVIG
jgi:hypothetical protein